jgi:hypothetical protein
MSKIITAKGRIKDSKIIEILDKGLDNWINEEVTVIVKKAKKTTTKEMIDEMKIGKDIGYRKINREDIYRG